MNNKIKYLTGFLYSASFSLLRKGIGLIGLTILSRYLGVKDFGTFAIVSFILELFKLISENGLGAAFVQKKEESDAFKISSLFFFQLGIVSICIVIILGISPFLQDFYPNFKPEYKFLLYALTLEFFIGTIKSIPKNILTRKVDFKYISQIELAENLTYWAVAITMALLNYGVWSLVMAVLLRSIIGTSLFFTKIDWKPKMHFSFAEVKEFLKFGLEFQFARIVEYLRNSITPIVIGHYFGLKAVGFISWTTQVTNVPRFILNALDAVSFPFFSRLEKDMDEIVKYLKKSLEYVSLLIFPLIATLFIFSNEFIIYVFSEKWLEVEYLLRLACIEFCIASFYYPFYSSAFALGHTRLILVLSCIITSIEFIFVILFKEQYGFHSIVYGRILTSLLSLVIYMGLYQFQYKRFINIFSILGRHLFVLGVSGGIVWKLKSMYSNNFTSFVLLIIAFGIIYLSLSLMVNFRLFKEVKNIYLDKLSKNSI